jgi:N6-adenosine-specific RNA methylase IME4
MNNELSQFSQFEPLVSPRRYSVIYADPPWQYKSRGIYQETFPKRKQTRKPQNVSEKYKTMDAKQIAAFNVKEIADRDCALFLWTTDSHLEDALIVIKAWGFKYRSIAFIWIKRSTKGKLCANVGAWTMKNAEICLIATKGNMAKHKIANNIYQVVDEIRTTHSKKPEEVRRRIERIFGELPRLELFARKKTDGWDVWGNEVESTIVLTATG